PACSLNPIAARFQRLVDRIGTDDVGRRQAIADLIRQLEWRYEGVKRMRREAALYELGLRRVRGTKGGGGRGRDAPDSARFLCRLGACLYDILRLLAEHTLAVLQYHRVEIDKLTDAVAHDVSNS